MGGAGLEGRVNLYPFEVEGLTQAQVESLCHYHAKEEARSRRLRRWLGVEYSCEIRVTGAEAGCVTKAAGPRRVHLRVRVPVWLADVINWCRGME
jgi:hypothetical protein